MRAIPRAIVIAILPVSQLRREEDLVAGHTARRRIGGDDRRRGATRNCNSWIGHWVHIATDRAPLCSQEDISILHIGSLALYSHVIRKAIPFGDTLDLLRRLHRTRPRLLDKGEFTRIPRLASMDILVHRVKAPL